MEGAPRPQQRVVKQHFVSAGYLARFTLGGQRDSLFYVFSPGHDQHREATPESVGFEKHYHDIDVPGFPPDHLEAFFGQYEGRACALFRTLSTDPRRSLLTDEERETLTAFLALQAARVPQAKRKYEKLVFDSRGADANDVVNSPQVFDTFLSVAEKYGIEVGPNFQSKLLEGLRDGHIFPVVHKTEASVGILRLTHAILDQLDGMHYSILYSDGPDWFVCSDYPVALHYELSVPEDLFERQRNIEWPKLKPISSSIYMPLAYNVAVMIHRLPDRHTAVRADRYMVSLVNSLTVSYAERFICSSTLDFTLLLPGGKQIGNAADAAAVLRGFGAPRVVLGARPR
jgi:hypothetical protein